VNIMIITPDTLIGDIIEGDVNIEAVANVLTSVGMHCLGCAIAHGETVGEAAEVHNVDVNELIARLNEAAKNNG
jgi:hybrid cluster-associated redox disulfide protein